MMWSPPNPKTFNALVWEIARQIPEGQVSSYGQIASMIPPPQGVDPEQYRRLGARWVGQAMRDCPSDVPWHRVMNSKGAISLPQGSAAADEQRARLEMENVVFDKEGYVDLSRVGWEGPNDEWLEARGLSRPHSLRKPPAQLNLL